MKQVEKQIIEELLKTISKLLYCNANKRRYFSERKMLVYAITWPASWLHERGLSMPQRRYKKFLKDRICEIKEYGDPERYQQYIPAYMLKCIQQWFIHNGDELYFELKTIRNAIDLAWEIIPKQSYKNDPYIEVMARTHQILRQQKRQRRRTCMHIQSELF